VPEDAGSLQPGVSATSNLLIDFAHPAAVSNYRRELNLDTATARVTYDIAGTVYFREVFVSKPNQVVAIRLSASNPGALNCKVRLASQLKSEINAYGANGIHLTAKAPSESAPNYLFAPGTASQAWVPPSIPNQGAPTPASASRPPRAKPQMNTAEPAAKAASDRLAESPIQYSEVEGKGMHFAAVLDVTTTGGSIVREPDGG
jgi:alpha-L-fucosidase 2